MTQFPHLSSGGKGSPHLIGLLEESDDLIVVKCCEQYVSVMVSSSVGVRDIILGGRREDGKVEG